MLKLVMCGTGSKVLWYSIVQSVWLPMVMLILKLVWVVRLFRTWMDRLVLSGRKLEVVEAKVFRLVTVTSL